ncbi:MAG: DEAD/DEAH box helicase [Saprospiraceae bacterium]|nr:DEAD/DEAH box helicase [Saprospiraceae bacterium]
MNNELTFEALGLSSDILNALAKKGFEKPTPIQQKTIPLLLQGERDIIGQAQTGTGKTAAFGLPLLERIRPEKGKVQAIVLVPTRELALQVYEEISSYQTGNKLTILPVYGGQGMDVQLRQLKTGVDIVVGTPGRVMDHLRRRSLKLDNVKFAVLDEADEMLNMGFIDDIETILEYMPENRRMLLFSATMPTRIRQLAKRFMGEFDEVSIEKVEGAKPQITHTFYEMFNEDKMTVLTRIIDTNPGFYGLVFCRTRAGSDRLAKDLSAAGYDAEALHGDVSQAQRERILDKFKMKKIHLLVATDVAARGIDVNNLSHVVNFDIPGEAETYTHRIGRTGRAGKTGEAITFIVPREFRALQMIMQQTRFQITKQQVPTLQEALEQRRAAVKHEIFKRIMTTTPTDEVKALAVELLSKTEPELLVSALLQQNFGRQLQAQQMREIKQLPSKGSDSPRTRESRDRVRSGGKGGHDSLFFGKGKTDGWKSNRLIQYISDTAGIPTKSITKVDLFQKHAIITVESDSANTILEKFRTPKGQRPLLRRDRV